MEFTIKAAVRSKLFDHICLSTDSEEYRRFGISCGAEAPFLRPKELSADSSSTSSVIAHALNWYSDHEGYSPEYIMLLQPTSPFRKPESIVKAFELIKNNQSDCLISVNEVQSHPCEYVIQKDSGFSYVMEPPEKAGRQNYPNVYFINGAIYICKTSYFKEVGQIFDRSADLLIVDNIEALDIDDEFDLIVAESIYEKYREEIYWL